MVAQSEDSIIVRKLELLVRLTAMDVTRGLPRSDQILMLREVGMEVGEIADSLGLKPNTVSVFLYQAKKKPKMEGMLDEDKRDR